MTATLINELVNRLPPGDSHPYRTGPCEPNTREYDDLEPVVKGSIPEDLNGTYIRNTENPVREALGRYHPFDGDGMLHSITFDRGRCEYRNRFIQTQGLKEEEQAGQPLWCGIRERPEKTLRPGGGG